MKRILSLDGGGVRGIFTLQILARIEALLREERKAPNLVLADVYDLIAGTSTGAIIAAFLALRKPIAEIERLYLEFGPFMFKREPWYRQWKRKYRADAVAGFFREHFSEDADQQTPMLMGSDRLSTKLLVLMRNATTGSPWPVTNHPDAHYNDRSRPDCNLDVPLWKLLRASTAAPTFFAPERVDFGHRKFLFVDGGVTPFNNPSLIAVLMATLPQYGFGWPSGREALHVVSVGTGSERIHLPNKIAEAITVMDQIKFAVPALIDAASTQQDMMCRVLGDCMFGAALDKELGDLSGLHPSLLTGDEKRFTYARYNQVFNVAPVEGTPIQELDMRLDRIANMPAYQQAGREYAEANVRLEHLYPRRAPARA
jgi:patatin-like phospholipase/acyl hydrolase